MSRINSTDPLCAVLLYAVGESIKSNRKRHGLTQKELSEISGVSAMSISRYETGERVPELITLTKIARAMSITLNDILKPVNEYECAKRIIGDIK